MAMFFFLAAALLSTSLVLAQTGQTELPQSAALTQDETASVPESSLVRSLAVDRKPLFSSAAVNRLLDTKTRKTGSPKEVDTKDIKKGLKKDSENSWKKLVENKKTKKDTANGLEETIEMVEALCDIYKVFDNMGRDENKDRSKPGFEWDKLCDDFEPLNRFMCPPQEIVQQDICQHQRPYLNPAVRLLYCRPLTALILDEQKRKQCETSCTQYISEDRGGCCNIDCNV